MADFDPLYYWLGIPPSEQPPDHYQLLGIRRFENDPQVIENAADRQTIHLKTFQIGPHSDDSQRLLNRVAAARVCLQNAAAKEAYDEQLRHENAENVVAAEETAASPAADYNANREDTLRAVSAVVRSDRWRRSKKSFLIVAVVATVVIVGTFAANQSVDTRPVAAPSAGTREKASPPSSDNPAAQTKSEPPTKSTSAAEVEEETGLSVNDSEKEDVADRLSAHIEQQSRMKGDAEQSISPATAPVNPPDNGIKKFPAVADAVGARPSQSPDENPPLVKHSPPSPAEQKEIAAQIAETYDFAVLKTPLDRTMLAERLMGDALKAKDKGGEQFMLLQRAAELAAEGGDPAKMFFAADAIAERYHFDASPLKLKLLKTCLDGVGTLEGLTAFWTGCESQINAYLLAERCEEALDAAKAVSNVFARSPNKTLRMQSLAWKKSLTRALKDHQKFLYAEKRLAHAADDPAANLIVGSWLCFYRKDYKAGLPHLAKGEDAKLAALARRESESPPKTANEKAALGDAWWDLGEKAKPDDRVFFCLHATDWYREALPELSVLSKATAQKRLAMVAEIIQFTQPQNKLAALVEQSNWQFNAPPDPKKKQRTTPVSMLPNGNQIVEGVGWRLFRVGATKYDLIKAMGMPDAISPGNNPTIQWLQWKQQYHVHCLIDDSRGAFELRFDPGFPGQLTTGIMIGSPEAEIMRKYGRPDQQKNGNAGAKKYIYSKKGVLFWTKQGRITQIVVFPRKS